MPKRLIVLKVMAYHLPDEGPAELLGEDETQVIQSTAGGGNRDLGDAFAELADGSVKDLLDRFWDYNGKLIKAFPNPGSPKPKSKPKPKAKPRITPQAALKTKANLPALKRAVGSGKPVKRSGNRVQFQQPFQPSPELAAIVGSKALPRTEVARKIWAYIKKNGLQDPKKRTMIKPDAVLGKVLGTKPISMFEMTKVIGKYLKPVK